MPHIIIAIDGPAASGKGTLARRLAEELGYAYLDTGALYRKVGYDVLQAGGDPGDVQAAIQAAEALKSRLIPQDLENPGLRTDEAGSAASQVSAVPEVRAALFDFQRDFATCPPGGASGVVLDGRDIGTVICPDADVKLFVTASLEIRAQRRYKELQSKGVPATYEAVLADMRMRDSRDSERSAAPLKAAGGAVVIDTSQMDASQALDTALDIVRRHIV